MAEWLGNYHIIIGASKYGPMDKKQTRGVLEVARKSIGGMGIYAIRKNKEITLLNHKTKTKAELDADIVEYRKLGYTVLWRND